MNVSTSPGRSRRDAHRHFDRTWGSRESGECATIKVYDGDMVNIASRLKSFDKDLVDPDLADSPCPVSSLVRRRGEVSIIRLTAAAHGHSASDSLIIH